MLTLKNMLGPTFIGSFLLLAGCGELEETTKNTVNDLEDVVQSELTKDEPHVLTVKDGSLDDYPDITIDEAFNAFFSSPTWEYFLSEEDEDIVEFTGGFMYEDVDAEATIQFQLHEDDRFEIVYTAFNDLPQNEFYSNGLLISIFEGEDLENPESSNYEVAVASEIGTPFQIGATLDELTSYYGDPSYDDYYMGGRLVVFNDEDGYFFDEETEIVYGFMISNPDIDILGTYIGMTPEEISAILSDPVDSYFDDIEGQDYVNIYYHENYNISYSSEEENGPTSSVIIMSEE
ncbi:hypothetical protein [Paenisporosarcina indica]|uniref:hypothetical protein n=1 Tax=Paenisporosarcina indica TaxID=650093 RepID=UPI00094FF850|nr:hypothetical protein [Paenisporosarcina indica]